jgi:hypothetical protein
MPRNDLLEQSAPRAELDQRSREARLRLERVERLLLARPLPKSSLLRRALRCLGSKIYGGQQIEGRSTHTTVTGKRARQGRGMRGETGGAAGGFSAISYARQYPAVPDMTALQGVTDHWKAPMYPLVPRCAAELGTNLGTKAESQRPAAP